MSAFYWLRVARRVTGLHRQPEYPELEALLESEAGEPHEDYRILARVIPPIMAVIGCITFVGAILTKNAVVLLAPAVLWVAAWGLWVLFDRLDRAIPRSKAQIRKRSEQIVKRMCGFSNIVGLDPALSPSVAEVMNEASGIYLKHSAESNEQTRSLFTESRAKAVKALEEAMARMLELGTLPTVSGQELELKRGWAMPLLGEMRELDRALDQHAQNAIISAAASREDALASLREARLDLQGQGSAADELEQHSPDRVR